MPAPTGWTSVGGSRLERREYGIPLALRTWKWLPRLGTKTAPGAEWHFHIIVSNESAS
jgi:hypothetical protein